MRCPDCSGAMILVSENDKNTTYQCVKCGRVVVEKKD